MYKNITQKEERQRKDQKITRKKTEIDKKKRERKKFDNVAVFSKFFVTILTYS